MMFKKSLSLFSKKSLVLAAMGFALTSCGRQESTTLTPWGNTANNGTCPAGSTFIAGYGCMYTGSSNSGSFVTTNMCTSRQLNATQDELACWVYPAYYQGSAPNFPYLASPGNTTEAWVGPEVRVNDQITLLGSLRYGSVGWSSFFGDCNNERDASPILNGAVGSSNLFALPIGTPVTMSTAGALRFGMSTRHSCYEAGSLYIRIVRNR